MLTDHAIYSGMFVYGTLFFVTAGGLVTANLRNQRDRFPIKAKLLRGPGESVRRELQQIESLLFPRLLMFAALPPLAANLLLLLFVRFAPTAPDSIVFLATGVVFILAVVPCVRFGLRDLLRHRTYNLAFQGERIIGDALAELSSFGYRIFHDVPTDAAHRATNFDHVVVGPSGLYLVETKTRRMSRKRRETAQQELIVDATRLTWPWGEDRNSIEQVQSSAGKLTEWIKRMTNLEVAANPILAIPGWTIRVASPAPVQVANHLSLCDAIRSAGDLVLSPAELALIARQLDLRCRNLED